MYILPILSVWHIFVYCNRYFFVIYSISIGVAIHKFRSSHPTFQDVGVDIFTPMYTHKITLITIEYDTLFSLRFLIFYAMKIIHQNTCSTTSTSCRLWWLPWRQQWYNIMEQEIFEQHQQGNSTNFFRTLSTSDYDRILVHSPCFWSIVWP